MRQNHSAEAAAENTANDPGSNGRSRSGRSFSFFPPHQAEDLISAASPHLPPIIIFLLYTGVRIEEAIDPDWRNVDLAGRQVILWKGATKSRRRALTGNGPAP